MRIAVTGTHGSGKSTLIGDFLDTHPAYRHLQEPYWELVQQGVVFADGPTLADLIEQFEQSAAMILASAAERHVIHDRSPVDFIAYLEVMSAREGDEWSPTGRQLAQAEKALASLDLLVFLPLSEPDEIRTSIEFAALRRAVDRRLKRILRDDDLGLFADGPRIAEITGRRGVRAIALGRIATGGAGS